MEHNLRELSRVERDLETLCNKRYGGEWYVHINRTSIQAERTPDEMRKEISARILDQQLSPCCRFRQGFDGDDFQSQSTIFCAANSLTKEEM